MISKNIIQNTILLSFFFIFSCNFDADNSIDGLDDLQSKYSQLKIKKVVKKAKGPDFERESFELILYPNGATKDSIVKLKIEDGAMAEETYKYSFYENGILKYYNVESIYGENAIFRHVYEHEGRKYQVNKRSLEEYYDMLGRSIKHKITYNDTHTFVTNSSYDTNIEREISTGPIGEIISDIEYKLDKEGKRDNGYDKIKKITVKVNEEFEESTFSFNKKSIHIVKMNNENIMKSCFFDLIDTVSEKEMKIFRYNCNPEESISVIESKIRRDFTTFEFAYKGLSTLDEFGNELTRYFVYPDGSISYVTNREILYNPDSTIRQENLLNDKKMVEGRSIYEYDIGKRLKTKKYFNLDDNSIEITEYIYSKSGLLLEIKITINDNWESSEIYEYSK